MPMKRTKSKQSIDQHGLSFNSGARLRGMQSVRVSFRLRAACIQAISILSTHLGIKQKSVFDHLMQDADSLDMIAGELRDVPFDIRNRTARTFVISRQSLETLEAVAQKHQAPRDALVEYSIQRLLPLIIKEQAKYDQRRELFAKATANYEQGRRILDEIQRKLGREDSAFKKLSTVMTAYGNAVATMAGFLEKAKVIEEFCPDKLRSL